MAAELRTVPLSELSKRITKGTTPTTLGHSFVNRGVNFVKSEAITDDGRIDVATFAFIDTATHEALGRSALEEDDVLFSMAGVYLGKTAVVPRSVLPANTNQAVGIIRLNRAKVIPRFIHYVLSSPECRALVRRSVAQSAQPNFNLRDIGALPIPVLPLSEQGAIAHILGTLDDKIELNRRMNETLEAIARALFKSWFVDFAPVRAKTEGRDPGLPKPLADIFPDSFEDSELGEIPMGWRVGKVSAFATLSRDGIDPADFPQEIFDHYSIPAYDEGQNPKGDTGDAIKSNKLIVPPTAVLLSKLNPRIPRIWLPHVQDTHRAVCSTEFLVALPRTGSSREFLHGFLSSGAFVSAFATLVTGTSGSHQRVNPDSLLSMDAVVPDEALVDAFTGIVRPLLMRLRCARNESRALAALRDALLPKLVSGAVRVRDVEARVAHS